MKRFKKIYIEITNVCNLRCVFCPETARAAAFMTLEDFHGILTQIRPFTDYVYFHVKGEPLLHPQLDQFLDLCDTYGLKVNITTNGTLIEQTAEKLLAKPALRQINFSLHSFDGNAPSGSKNDYIDRILSYINRSGAVSETLISLRLWNLSQADTKTAKNFEVLHRLDRAFHLPALIEEQIKSSYGVKIAENVYLSQDSEFDWPALDQVENSAQGFCYGLKSQLAVLVDGTVVPCCLDGEGVMQLGNIHQTPFSDIISSERAVRICQGFARREVVEALCRRCTYRNRFNKTPRI